jgi:hypothetical protein
MAHASEGKMKSLAVAFVTLSLALCACSAGANSSGTDLATAAPGALLPGDSPTPEPDRALSGPGDTTERWIEVSLREQVIRLHDSGKVAGEYLASTGVGGRPEYTTYPGLFDVRRVYRGPVETAPGVFVMNVLEFDMEHGNAIHSPPMDRDGRILDNRLGEPLTAGCVRVGESAIVYEFAALGMIVWIH